MTREQAKDIVTLLRAATGGRADQDTLAYFEASLEHLDYDPALAAANTGTVTWRWFPSWSEFREIYKMQQRLREPVGEQRYETPLPRPTEAPEWVFVWTWARNKRDPQCRASFPQQLPHVDPNEVMSDDEYEALRQEWEAAGSPKPRNPIPLAVTR